MKKALTNGQIVLPYRMIHTGYVVMEQGKITEIGSGEYKGDGEIIDVKGAYVSPGFIDQHIHGAYNADAMDATLEELETMRIGLLQEGTTSYLATTMTETDDNIKKALQIIRQSMESSSQGAHIIGIHQEGPFISKKWKGAQREDAIAPGTIQKMEQFIIESGEAIRLITYAIENTTTDFTRFLVENKIVPSVAHSNATFDDVEKHVNVGLANVTHFHNAMTPHHHREPGIVTAGFYFDDLKTELIVDGIHVHPDVVKTTYKIKGADNIILITDAMRAKGMPDGTYDLGGQDVHKIGPEARLSDGTLAGSVLLMNHAVKNIMNYTNCSLVEAIRMATYNPSKQLGFDNKGRIAVGADADIIVFDDNVDIKEVYLMGEQKFKA